MDELQETVETLIDLDEPEALVATLRQAAKRKRGERWQALADELLNVEAALNARQQPDARKLRAHIEEWAPPANRATGDSQPQPVGADHGKHPDAAPEAAAAATSTAATPAAAATSTAATPAASPAAESA